jgi:hypothetical protein
MYLTFKLSIGLVVAGLVLALPTTTLAQRTKPAKPKPRIPAESKLRDAAAKYYRIVGLGSTEGDSTNTFPYPTAILEELDTAHHHIVVRFPELGMLGLREDTVTAPAFYIGDSLRGYAPQDPLILLAFPKTQYFVFIDVWTRDDTKLLDSRPFEYDMDVRKYKTAKLIYVHVPTTGLGNLTMRCRFSPTLLPFSIETNPGWGSTETLDSTLTYALVFHDPQHPEKVEMSISMRPTFVGRIDSATWQNFKQKAQMAFGSKGVAVNSGNDFQVDDVATRRYIKAGFEFVAKSRDSTLDYVGAFLTPRAILLMMATMDEPNQQLQYDYFKAIARSLKLE